MIPPFHNTADVRDWLQYSPDGRGILASIFPTIEHPREWLEGTPEGNRLIGDILARYTPRESVLIVVEQSSPFKPAWIEVYGERSLSVHIAHKLRTSTNETSILAEEYLERKLPKRYRRLYMPGNLRRFDLATSRRSEDELRVLLGLAFLECLRYENDEMYEHGISTLHTIHKESKP
jgi:hypothetical protein